VIASVGALSDQHIDYAQSLLARIPQRLRDSIRGALGRKSGGAGAAARHEPGDVGGAAEGLLALGDPQLADHVSRASAALRTAPAEAAACRISTFALPAVATSVQRAVRRLRRPVDRLIRADSRHPASSSTRCKCVLLRHLAAHFEPKRPETGGGGPQIEVVGALSVLLSMLAHAGAADPAEAARAFEAARAQLSGDRFFPRCFRGRSSTCARWTAPWGASVTPRHGSAATSSAHASQPWRRTGRWTIRGGRAAAGVSDSLGCPMPPLLPGQHIGEEPGGP